MAIFKDSFPSFVKDELNKRQNNISNHSFQTIATLTNRTAWIRMISGVSITNYPTAANDWVLYGGDNKNIPQIFSGYTNQSNLNNNLMGIRPIPGILNIDVDSISANGSLRKVTVNFFCPDVKQLEILEKLYMRPGYSVCVEWGWSSNIGDNKILSSLPKFGDEFLKINTNQSTSLSNLSLLDIYKNAYSYVQNSNGNYDVCIGKISNYNWRVRPDGGYDCSTTIITYGEILESLKVNYVANASINSVGIGLMPPVGSTYSSSELPRQHYEKSLLDGLLFEMKSWVEQQPNGVYDVVTKNQNTPSLSKVNSTTVFNPLNIANPVINVNSTSVGNNIIDYTYKIFSTDQIPNSSELSEIDVNSTSNSAKKSYIMLRDFCRLISDYILPVNNNGKITNITTSPIKLSSPDDTQESVKINAYPIQLPMDVNICVFYPSFWVEGVELTQKSSTQLSEDNIKKPQNGNTFADTISLARANNLENPAYITQMIVNVSNFDATNPKPINSINIIQTTANNQISDYIAKSVNSILAFSKVNGDIYTAGVILKDPLVTPILNSLTSLNNGYVVTTDEGFKFIIDNNKIVQNFKGLDYQQKFSFSSTSPAGIKVTSNLALSDVIDIEKLTNVLENLSLANRSQYFDQLFQAATLESANINNQIVSNIVKNIFDPIKSYKFFADNIGSSAFVGNIFISIDFIVNALDRNEASDPNSKSEVSLSGLFTSILAGIQNSIGSINDLRLFVDPLDNIARIVDIEYVDQNTNNLFEIQLHNTNSVVKSYNLESLIFPEQSTLIAVSAQTKSGKLGYGNQHLVAYNDGIIDRVIQQIDTPVQSANISKIDEIQILLGSIASYYKSIIEHKKPYSLEPNLSASKVALPTTSVLAL